MTPTDTASPRERRINFKGGGWAPLNDLEWFLANLPDGTPIEWEGGDTRFGRLGAGVGVLKFIWWYDGLVAEVDCGGRRVPLHPATDKGLVVRVLEDTSRLAGPGIGGDGI